MNTSTELELLDRCASGDRDAFGEIVERYQTLVCAVAYSLLGDFALSEDIGQDAFIVAWKQLPTLRDRSRFRPWICAIARNLARAALRSKRPAAPLEGVYAPIAGGPSPEEAAQRREEESLVWTALAGLPESYREPLVLFYRQDCSVACVAEALELSPATVKQRLARGRALLREEVCAMAQRALKRRVSTAAFTAAVLGALPGLGVASASAAVIGTAGRSTPLAASVLKTGMLASLAGSVVGLAGGALGTWMGWKNARYQREREMLLRQSIRFAVVMAVFLTPFVALGLGWQPWQTYGRNVYLTAYLIWMGWFFLWLPFWIWRCQRQWQHAVSEAESANDPLLPSTRISRWRNRWQGRQWTSRRRFLGLPLVEIAVSAGDGRHNESGRTPRVARAWIAVGDRAYGVLFAFGTVAAGGIACGAVSIGLIAAGGACVGIVGIGGCAIALCSYGGLGIGAVACGGIAAGWFAVGGVAIAWRAAKGGVAVARHYAVGGVALAADANNAEARQFVATTPYFEFSDKLMQDLGLSQGSLWFQGAVACGSLVFVALMWLVMFRRSSNPS